MTQVPQIDPSTMVRLAKEARDARWFPGEELAREIYNEVGLHRETVGLPVGAKSDLLVMAVMCALYTHGLHVGYRLAKEE